MKKFFRLLVIFAAFELLGSELPMEQFLQKARRSNPVATFAKLHGSLQHRRKNAENLTMPIYFGVILHPDRTVGQLILDETEGYMLGQAKASGLTSVSLMANSSKTDRLGFVGVRASDLMMSFLFCKPEKELDSEIIKGVVHCRVFLLDDPDNREKIKVWITSEHAFPVKAEFYRYGEIAPFRELEAGALTKKNDLYYVRRIQLNGPGWSTKIDFDADTAEINQLDQQNLPRIIKPLRKEKK